MSSCDPGQNLGSRGTGSFCEAEKCTMVEVGGEGGRASLRKITENHEREIGLGALEQVSQDA